MNNIFDKINIKDVEDVITFDSPKGRVKKIENRKSYGLSFCTEGQITYEYRGKKFISNETNAIILPQGASYTLYGDRKGVFPVINFTCTGNFCDDMVIFPVENPDIFISDYEQMKALSIFEGNRAKIISIFYNILHHLSLTVSHSSNTLAPAIKHLQENYHNPSLTNETLARECRLSEVHFRKLFLKQYNTTPKQYVIDIRIDKAKQLLTDGIMKINAIAEECGFSNPYHFCRVFKQKTGMTPTEYMKNNKIYKI